MTNPSLFRPALSSVHGYKSLWDGSWWVLISGESSLVFSETKLGNQNDKQTFRSSIFRGKIDHFSNCLENWNPVQNQFWDMLCSLPNTGNKIPEFRFSKRLNSRADDFSSVIKSNAGRRFDFRFFEISKYFFDRLRVQKISKCTNGGFQCSFQHSKLSEN